MLLRFRSHALSLLFAALALMGWIVAHSISRPAPHLTPEILQVAPAVPVQLVYAFGDRYLAANIASWRATVVGGSGLAPETMQALARIQEDASWLNPAHEDNYYTAAAVLPWEGYVDEAQTILGRAIDARPKDLYPPFLYAFDQLNFRGDVPGAVAALRIAEKAAGTDGERDYFKEMADRWAVRGDDLSFPIQVIGKMAAGAHNHTLKQFLERQLLRLKGLAELRATAVAYRRKFGRDPVRLEEMTEAGMLKQLPNDPSGFGYELRDGVVFLRTKKMRQGD